MPHNLATDEWDEPFPPPPKLNSKQRKRLKRALDVLLLCNREAVVQKVLGVYMSTLRHLEREGLVRRTRSGWWVRTALGERLLVCFSEALS